MTEHFAEKEGLWVEYEIQLDRGNGWESLNRVISNSSPVTTLDEARENVRRVESIADVDPYYEGARTRIIKVERSLIPSDK